MLKSCKINLVISVAMLVESAPLENDPFGIMANLNLNHSLLKMSIAISSILHVRLQHCLGNESGSTEEALAWNIEFGGKASG